MSRWKATGLHFAVSVLVAALVASLIYFAWYPQPYFQVAGGSTLVLLIMSVDVVLGPFLTLVIFKSGKKGLKFDMAVIALLQMSAFAYGINVVAAARPVFVVASVDRFVTVCANDLDDEDMAQSVAPQFAYRSWRGPRLVAAVAPTGDAAASDIGLAPFHGGKDIDKYPKYYVEYMHVADRLMEHSKPLAELMKKHPDDSAKILQFVKSFEGNISDLVYLPLIGRTDAFSMVVSTRSKLPVGALSVDPW